MFATRRWLTIAAGLALAALGAAVAWATFTASTAAGRTGASATDLTRLPLGDGHVSTTSARRGWIYGCTDGNPSGGGAFRDGPWIDTANGTFNEKAKVNVAGTVTWSQARVSFTRLASGQLRVTGNDLPTDRTTGTFPIASTDPAYSYDRNPNSIAPQSLSLTLPKPSAAAHPSCLNGGPIGIALNGVEIFDGLDALNRDAVAHETQDACSGHPQMSSAYHYHDDPACLWSKAPANRASGLFGYALDGYPIFGPRGAGGRFVTDAQLDACHGTTSTVALNGRRVRTYHYVATLEYPYTLGCFHGTPIRTATRP
jgi:YHYH protein